VAWAWAVSEPLPAEVVAGAVAAGVFGVAAVGVEHHPGFFDGVGAVYVGDVQVDAWREFVALVAERFSGRGPGNYLVRLCPAFGAVVGVLVSAARRTVVLDHRQHPSLHWHRCHPWPLIICARNVVSGVGAVSEPPDSS